MWGASLLCAAALAHWPNALGPTHNGEAPKGSLAPHWDSQKPAPAWVAPAGEGFAGAVSDGTLVFLWQRFGDKEALEARNLKTGTAVWGTAFPASYRGSVIPDSGPLATPCVADGRVFALGADGRLVAMATEDGTLLWEIDLAKTYRASAGYFGFGHSPLVHGGTLVVNVGGADKGGVVGFDPATGKKRWEVGDERASYNGVVPAGPDHVWCVTRYNLLRIATKNGAVTHKTPFGMRGPTVNGAFPVVLPNQHLFVTASYRIGARLFKVGASELSLVWEGDGSLSTQYGTPVQFGEMLIGLHGREDQGVASLRAIRWRDGKVLWEVPEFGMGHLVKAGDALLIQRHSGELLMAYPNQTGLQQKATYQVGKGPMRSMPALVGSRWIVREADNPKQANWHAVELP